MNKTTGHVFDPSTLIISGSGLIISGSGRGFTPAPAPALTFSPQVLSPLHEPFVACFFLHAFILLQSVC
jgi:hypothetical protein